MPAGFSASPFMIMGGSSIPHLDTYADLRAATAGYAGSVWVRGRTAADGYGEGLFYWIDSITTADDDGITLAPNSGAVGRWVRAFDSPVNVEWYGGKGDGVATGQGAAFSAAITYAYNHGGGDVFVPCGTYKITGAASGSDRVTLKSNVRLIFEPGCIINTGTISATGIVLFLDSHAAGTSLSNVTIEGNGLQINLYKSNVYLAYGVYVYHYAETNTMSNVIVRGVKTDGGWAGLAITGESITGPYDCLFEDCYFSNAYSTCAYIDRGHYLRFVRCRFTTCTGSASLASGFDIEPQNSGMARDIYFDDCHFLNNQGIGLYLQEGSSTAYPGTARVFVSNCLFDGNGALAHGSGFAAASAYIVSISRSVSSNNQGDGFNGGQIYEGCRAYNNSYYGWRLPFNDVTMTNCKADANGYGGILCSSYVNYYKSAHISNCEIVDHTDDGAPGIHLSGAHNWSISGCRITGNKRQGIRVTKSNNNSIANCYIAGNGRQTDVTYDNIWIEGDSNYNNFIGNFCRQNDNYSYGQITAGSGTTTSVNLNAYVSDVYSCRGLYIRIVGGTGSGTGPYLITAYNQSTRQADIFGTFGTTPDNTSVVEVTGFSFHRGQIVAGSATSSTCKVASFSEANYSPVGMELYVVSGTGSGSGPYTITAFNQSTGQVTISGSFSPSLDNTSVVQISTPKRPRYGIRIDSGALYNKFTGNDVWYAGGTSGFSDAGTGTIDTATRST